MIGHSLPGIQQRIHEDCILGHAIIPDELLDLSLDLDRLALGDLHELPDVKPVNRLDLRLAVLGLLGIVLVSQVSVIASNLLQGLGDRLAQLAIGKALHVVVGGWIAIDQDHVVVGLLGVPGRI